MSNPHRLPILRALRDLTDSGHPDITPAAVSHWLHQGSDFAWQELARCRADGLADRTPAAVCTWFITEAGRAEVAAAERGARAA